jgi:hypothetical protein
VLGQVEIPSWDLTCDQSVVIAAELLLSAHCNTGVGGGGRDEGSLAELNRPVKSFKVKSIALGTTSTVPYIVNLALSKIINIAMKQNV